MDADLKQRIETLLGEPLTGVSGVGGGSIADTRRVETASGAACFLKTGFRGRMFRCEADGLRELALPGVIRVPKVIAADDDFLLIEYIERGVQRPGFFTAFGRALARLHRHRGNSFGFREDNFIGSTPQPNLAVGAEKTDWLAFYWNKRMLYQYRLAERHGYATAVLRNGFHRLENRLPAILSGSEEPPCLLHGDLWSGNYLCDASGGPVLIDPAVYYGHREADLAMTKLFGGFSPEFYAAYQEEYPLLAGWEYRESIYKLYHVLNHLNLFGTGYLHEAESILRFYLR